MNKVIPTDIYDKDGNMIQIEFHNSKGDFEFQVVWDPNDEQNSANREELRKYAYRMAGQLGYEVDK